MIFRGTFTTRCCGTFSRVDEGVPEDDDVAIPQDILRRSDNVAESRILRANPPCGADHPRPAVAAAAAPATPAAACSLLLLHALLASPSTSYASILTPAVSVSILVVVSALKQHLSSLRGHAEHDERSARATSAAAIVVSSN